MFNPKEMTRVAIMGPLSSLERAIERLHALRLLHPIDFDEPTKDFRRGQPPARASELSNSLVKLRSMGNILNLASSSSRARGESHEDEDKNLTEKILALELNMYEDTLAKKETEDALRDVRQKMEIYMVFTALGLPFDYYSSYRSLAVFVGTVGHPTDDLPQTIGEHEITRAENVIALFVPLHAREAAEAYLASKAFSPIEPPDKGGDPNEKLRELSSQLALLEIRHKEALERMEKLKSKHASFIVEAEKILARDVEKAEAPLLCATSDHAFVMDGWLPRDALKNLEEALGGIHGVHVEAMHPEAERPPVLLDNPAPSRPFEILLNLYSTPSYEEIDPTVVLSFIFPLFLGFMIGDAGFGLVMVGLGLSAWKSLSIRESLGTLFGMGDKTARRIGIILLAAGIFSVFFGIFVFAEFLAIPLQPTHEAKIEVGSWTEYLGIQFPFVPLIHKIEEVTDLLVISIAAAGIHLGIGYLFGIRNALRHDRKHAFAKIGWLLVLVALISEIMLAVKGTRAGGFIVQNFLPFASWKAFTLGQIPFSPVSLVMLLSGIVMILPAEGVMALPEVIGLFANILSYARLAGIAVAETAIALGFIKILFLVLSLGNVIIGILGCLLVLAIYALVFVLGIVAAWIQDVRLNYVEFFRKFFEGNGVPFRPFGMPVEG